jgi:hypothetical protein
VTGQQVGQLLAQNNARLTDISAYTDVDGTVKFAVIMAPADQEWWWYPGLDGNGLAQTLNANHARLTALTPMPNPVIKLSFGPFGTGPLGDSADTAGSGLNKCQYQVSLSIQEDGTCNFSGYYENRGVARWGTAPPQAYIVAMIVFDTAGNGYTFVHSGEVLSAPQQGAVADWNITRNYPVIAGNWNSIAARNAARSYWWNEYDESPWEWLSQLGGSVPNWIKQNIGTIEQDVGTIGKFVEVLTTIAGAAADPLPRPPLPSAVPTGAAAVAGGSSGPQAAAAPAGSPAPPIAASETTGTPQAGATPGS